MVEGLKTIVLTLFYLEPPAWELGLEASQARTVRTGRRILRPTCVATASVVAGFAPELSKL